MPQKIITLPKQLANQIAAGEVVERPLSVVKELIENSIDAGATQIDIRLKNGGIDLIEVCDNGCGIEKGDVKKSLEKYSTSKISSLEDLYHVMTFGFRGEALASIASVSQFTLNSKTQENTAGRSIYSEGGENITLGDIAHEVGTSVKVEHLFFNTPARLNYLKKPRTEYVKILDFLQRISLSSPHVGFSLEHDGKQTFHFPPEHKIESRIHTILGKEFQENMLEVSYEFGGIRVSGYISDPKISFSNKERQMVFVNKRVIGSPLVSKSIFDAYNRFIPHGLQPAYIIFLDIDPTQVDVNVHPRKMEVRFAGEQNLFRSVYHAVKNELEAVSLVNSDNSLSHMEYLSSIFHTKPHPQSLSSQDREETGPNSQYYTGSGTKFKNYSPYKNIISHPNQAAIEFSSTILGNQVGEKESALSRNLHETPLGHIIGQAHNAYIIVQTQIGIQILDQHALAERVIYEKLVTQNRTIKTQKLLAVIGMHLTLQELESLENYEEQISSMGFEINILSQGNILIEGIPDFIHKEKIESVFRKILGDISEIGSKGLDEVQHKIWAYTACRSAVKFGDPLSIFEMHQLLCDASLEYSATCPHGRPVVYDIHLDELQKKYER